MRIVEKLKLDMRTTVLLVFLSIIIILCGVSLIIGSMAASIAIPIMGMSIFLIVTHLISRKKAIEKQITSFIMNASDSEHNGQLSSAVYYYNEALALDKRDIKAIKGKIRCFIKMKERQKALTLSKQLVMIAEKSADAHYLMAFSYYQSRMLDEAETHLARSLKLDEWHSDSVLLMADIQKQLKRKTEAIKYYEKFLEISKDKKAKEKVREKINSIKTK